MTPEDFGRDDLEAQGAHEIARLRAGSEIHGIQIGSDDHDVIAVAMEPWQAVFGMNRWDHMVRRTAGKDQRSQPGDIDLTVYGLRKFCRLALQGNPSILQVFFTSTEDHLRVTPLGTSLLAWAPHFLSRQAIDRYLGYMHGQRQRAEGDRGFSRGTREGRSEKWASHMVRLGYQGRELATTGRVTLPMPTWEADVCKAIKRGEVDLGAALQLARVLEGDIRDARDSSPLPENPDKAKVEECLRRTYLGFFAGERAFEPRKVAEKI